MLGRRRRELHGRRKLSVVLEVGGITLGVADATVDQVPDASRAFLSRQTQPDVLCSRATAATSLSDQPLLFDSGGSWRVDARDGGGIRLVLRAGLHPGRPYHWVDLSPELDHGIVTLDEDALEREADPFLLRAPLHELWTAFLLWRGRGLLVHGCGLLTREGVHLFTGESGAGKSTLAAILTERFGTVLSDDRIVVRPEPGGFRAYGTPWHGESRHAAPASGRLISVHFLAHGRVSRCIPLGGAQAAARLAATCFMAGWPRHHAKELLETCVRLVERIPCRELHFTPDESAAHAAGLDPCL